MRISDWSSDVCSSDLGRKDSWPAGRGERGPAWRPHRRRRPFEHHLARDPNPPTSGNSGPCTRRTTAVIAAGIAPGESLMPSPHWASASVRGLETTERSEEHTSELPSLMRISYAVFCLTKKKQHTQR